MKNKLILLLAIAFALVAAFGTYLYLNNLRETYRETGNFTKVAIAAKHIPAKTPITEQMLEFKEMPAKYVLPGSIVNLQDAVGKLARSDIYPGEYILQSKLIGKNDPAGGLAAKVTPGQRAVTIAVDQISALAGLVTPGDRVDVAVTLSAGNDTVTSTIIYNIPVLAINKNTEPARGNNKTSPETATLMVTPQQAQQLVLASEVGSVRLLLRSPQDDNAAGLPSSRQRELIR